MNGINDMTDADKEIHLNEVGEYFHAVEMTWIHVASNGIEIRCVICKYGDKGRSWRCGYVKAPREAVFEEFDISVHGGLTFAEDGWIGFDCNHHGDTPQRWTSEAVKRETEDMAEQVAAKVPVLLYLSNKSSEEG